MQTWRTTRWLLPAALAGVLGIAATDAVMLRRKPLAPATKPIPERIGLSAETDGDALQLQWDHRSRPIQNADHAIVYIQDGKYQSQLDLNDQQLNNATVRYWPESPTVTFRMEVYNGKNTSSDTLRVTQTVPSRTQAPRAVAKAIRPSPFQRVRPEVVRRPSELRHEPVVPVVTAAVDTREPQVAHESGLSRVVGKIPLLRRLKKHPQTAD